MSNCTYEGSTGIEQSYLANPLRGTGQFSDAAKTATFSSLAPMMFLHVGQFTISLPDVVQRLGVL
jgi:hypothetical protein